MELVARLRMLLRDRTQRIWSDDALDQVIEAVCIENYIDQDKPRNQQKILWASTAWAIAWMLEEPPSHLTPLHLSKYRVLMGNAGAEAGRATHV